MDFAKKALFKRYGVIYLSQRALRLLPSEDRPAVLYNTVNCEYFASQIHCISCDKFLC